jgi:arginine/lysine/ornithine decarboxylase
MKKLRIYNAIKTFAKKRPLRFAMPGHKGNGRFFSQIDLAKFDVTELTAIENEKVVRDAEKDCQQILGSKHSRFLTDGSTAGIFSMLYAVKDRGDKIIINRTAHKSVYNALKLLNISPIIVRGNISNGVECIPSPEVTEKVLDANPDAIGVFYTYPDYYGRKYRIKNLCAIVKKHGKLLIIDGAHGGHYKFIGEEYIGAYADLWVDGAHKTLPTLNQGAIVSTNNAELTDKLDEAVGVFSTTSPSYPILASIEYGIKYMSEHNNHERFLDALDELKVKIAKLGLAFMEKTDAYKLAVDFGSAGYDTDEIEKLLIGKGVHLEMNDKRNLLFMFSAFTHPSELKRLYRAIEYACSVAKKTDVSASKKIPIPESVMPYLQAVNADSEYVLLTDAVGRIVGENVGKFPPCYPIVVAGERITLEVVNALNGENVFGIKDGKIKVVKEN